MNRDDRLDATAYAFLGIPRVQWVKAKLVGEPITVDGDRASYIVVDDCTMSIDVIDGTWYETPDKPKLLSEEVKHENTNT